MLHLCTKNLDMIYSFWDIECDVMKLVIMGNFLPFDPPNNPKNQILKKWKKRIKIILHLCTTNDGHMMYGSWYRVHQTYFCAILGYFLPFYPTNNLKNQSFEKMKEMPGDIILHLCITNDNHMTYGS